MDQRNGHPALGHLRVEKTELTPINPFAVSGGFLQYCIDRGWMVREGASRKARYFVTPDGVKKLAELGITRLT